MANQFAQWEKSLQNAMESLSGGTKAKMRFEVSRKPSKVLTDFEKLLTEFGITFMQEYFVNEVFKPAFFAGQGTGMGAGASSAYEFMPHIEAGYSHKTKSTTYERHKGKNPSYYRGMEEAIATGNWDAIYKQQEEERLSGIERDHRDSHKRAVEASANSANETASFVGTWETGFGRLFAAMTTLTPAQVGGTSVRIQMGPGSDILSQKLGPYSVSEGMASPSEYDSFFYAAEFGTGVARNVGGAQWIREAKKNNAQNGPFKGPPGSWWFGDSTHGGGLWSGQRGIHFLFDPATRQPLPIYRDWIAKNIGIKFGYFMSQRTGGKLAPSKY